jgi:chorismate mutase
MAILERVNVGRSVTESKYLELTAEFHACAGDREGMRNLLVRRDRERVVIELATRLADRYELPADAVVPVFEFMISVTVDIELDYLQARIEV